MKATGYVIPEWGRTADGDDAGDGNPVRGLKGGEAGTVATWIGGTRGLALGVCSRFFLGGVGWEE